MEGAGLLDLVCGPAGPLPETSQRYRLVTHLASGGQAEVYRAVRVSGGISSAPVTVKVFRPGDDRPVPDQLRSWDKGDAVLMDLNSRGVSGICRRADGFYAPAPYAPGRQPAGEPVPYQVLDYLHGVTLREYVAQRYGLGSGPRLDAVAALTTLAGVLDALHQPGDPRACPVLHMDVKPANVILLTDGQVRLIDFTGARYHWRDHITSVAYTRGAAAPEALHGEVGPAYDVHGFGAVAYYLVTGAFPRTETSPPDGSAAPPWSVLRRHPLLERNPALAEHLLAPVADRPEDRPATRELSDWVRRLAALVTSSSSPDVGVDWGRPAAAARGVAAAAAAGGAGAVAGGAAAAVAGTETGAFARIERLERELVELRSVLGGNGAAVQAPAAQGSGAGDVAGARPAGPQPAAPTRVTPIAAGPQPPGRRPESGPRPDPTAAGPEPTRVAPPLASDGTVRGVATVPAPEPEPTLDGRPPQPRPAPVDRRPRPDLMTVLNRGSEITGVGVMFVFVCWGIWSVASGRGGLLDKFLVFVFVLLIGLGVFILGRLVGRLVWEKLMHRVRRNARGAHALTGAYLAAAGIGFLGQTGWVVDLWGWLTSLA